MTRREAFYKSKQWEDFRLVVIAHRKKPDGYIYCEHCGKPILKDYDLIAHHKIELTEANVDDVSISLNEDNIELIHFKCHNKHHHRFGYQGQRTPQKVFIVYGPPCAGKTTWVKEVSTPDDLIVDIDRLYAAVRCESCDSYEKPNAVKNNVFAIRDTLLDNIKTRYGRWQNAYVIGGFPYRSERERMETKLNASSIYINTPKEICLERAKLRPSEWERYVLDWYKKNIPPGQENV